MESLNFWIFGIILPIVLMWLGGMILGYSLEELDFKWSGMILGVGVFLFSLIVFFFVVPFYGQDVKFSRALTGKYAQIFFFPVGKRSLG